MSGILGANKKKLFSFENNKSVSTEVINFQNDSFGKDLEEVVTVIYDKITEADKQTEFFSFKEVKANIKPELDILVKLIYDRLGLKVNFIIDDMFMPAAIIPFFSNHNHVLLSEGYRDGGLNSDDGHKRFFSLMKKREKITGTINIEKAKVSGIFSEFENDLFFNFKQLIVNNRLSVPELVSVLLHELGHGFYACEYASRLEENNQVLINSLEELFSKKDKKDLTYVFKEIKSINDKVTESDIDDIVNGKNIIPGLKFFKVAVGVVESQLSNKKYNESSFEQLADNFSNRFGYGRQIVSALQKLTNYNPFLAYFIYTVQTVDQTRMLMLMLSVFFVKEITLLGILYYILISINVVFSLYFVTEGGKDYTYDNLNIRYKRIRNDIVEKLKNKNINKETNILAMDSIKQIDEIILNTPVPETIYKKLLDYVLPFSHRAKSSITEQQLMEDLVSNDLFIKSTQLKNI